MCLSTFSSSSLFSPTIVVNCPRSLKCLITYYRCLGFTFTGVVFTDSLSNLPAKNKRKLTLLSRLFLLWHLFFLLNTALFASSTLIDSLFWPTVIGEMNRSPFNQYGRLMKYSVDKYNFEFAHFKAILRGSLALIGHTFVGDNLLNYGLNLLYGRRLLKLVLKLPNIRQLDDKGRLGIKLIILPMIFQFFGIFFALVTFCRPYLSLLISWALGSTELSNQELEDVGQLLVIIFIWPQYLSLQLKSTVIYYYLMDIFQKNLLLICQSVEQQSTSPLNDQALIKVQKELRILAGHLEQINALLWPALSWALAGSVHLLVATVCYFVVLNRNSSPHHYYSIILFAYLLFALLRLLMLSAAGSRLPAAYERLLQSLYENITAKSNGGKIKKECSMKIWLAYQQLIRMKARFRSRLCADAFELSQGSLMNVLGFALSYIIILLQTENSW